MGLTKRKTADLYTSLAILFFAMAVLWNQAVNNQYGTLIATGGIILALTGIWRALVK